MKRGEDGSIFRMYLRSKKGEEQNAVQMSEHLALISVLFSSPLFSHFRRGAS